MPKVIPKPPSPPPPPLETWREVAGIVAVARGSASSAVHMALTLIGVAEAIRSEDLAQIAEAQFLKFSEDVLFLDRVIERLPPAARGV